VFVGGFAGRTMRVGNHRGARPISLALVAGLVAFEAVLALGAGAVGIPGVLLVRFADRSGGAEATQSIAAPEGGESTVAKLPAATESSKQAALEEAAKPVATVEGEPRLDGLSEIPLKPWFRHEAKPDEPKAFAASSAGNEVLPWDAVEPVPFSPPTRAAQADATASFPKPAMPETPRAPVAPMQLPASGEVETWVKAKATEVKGDDRARPLYHFEFWLELPQEMKRRLVAVAYDFNTPAVMPQSQMSSEEKTGFRVSAGGLACADKVTVTLKFSDGRSQQVAVDGCRLLG
jgi:hypothetical protein